MFKWIVGTIRDYRSYAIMAGQLDHLDDDLLSDIGLDPATLRRSPTVGPEPFPRGADPLAKYIQDRRRARTLAALVYIPDCA